MPFLLLIIGAIIFIAAYQNTHGELASQLSQDVPPFLKWGMAIAAVGALGFVPGMRDLSRWLLALVLVVIVLTNYKQIIAGLQSIGSGASSSPQPTAASQAAAGQVPTQAAISGGGNGTLVAGGALTGGSSTSALQVPSLNFDPGQFSLSSLTSSLPLIGGFF